MKDHFNKTTNSSMDINRITGITKIIIIFIISIAIVLYNMPVSASDLDDFEKTATMDTSQQSSSDQDQEAQDDDQDDDIWADILEDIFGNMFEVFFDMLFSSIANGAKMSLARIEGATDNEAFGKIEIRQTGEPILPFIQMNYKYLFVNPDISACDYGLEIGYGPYAYECINTCFTEMNPIDNMTLTQYHLLLRISGNRFWECGIGAGMISLCGNEQHQGFSLTFPLKIYLNESCGIKYKPTLNTINNNEINSQDFSIVYTKRYGSFEVGYRILETGNESLNGSFVGFALHY